MNEKIQWTRSKFNERNICSLSEEIIERKIHRAKNSLNEKFIERRIHWTKNNSKKYWFIERCICSSNEIQINRCKIEWVKYVTYERLSHFRTKNVNNQRIRAIEQKVEYCVNVFFNYKSEAKQNNTIQFNEWVTSMKIWAQTLLSRTRRKHEEM
jgi:hypothetical protein